MHIASSLEQSRHAGTQTGSDSAAPKFRRPSLTPQASAHRGP